MASTACERFDDKKWGPASGASVAPANTKSTPAATERTWMHWDSAVLATYRQMSREGVLLKMMGGIAMIGAAIVDLVAYSCLAFLWAAYQVKDQFKDYFKHRNVSVVNAAGETIRTVPEASADAEKNEELNSVVKDACRLLDKSIDADQCDFSKQVDRQKFTESVAKTVAKFAKIIGCVPASDSVQAIETVKKTYEQNNKAGSRICVEKLDGTPVHDIGWKGANFSDGRPAVIGFLPRMQEVGIGQAVCDKALSEFASALAKDIGNAYQSMKRFIDAAEQLVSLNLISEQEKEKMLEEGRNLMKSESGTYFNDAKDHLADKLRANPLDDAAVREFQERIGQLNGLIKQEVALNPLLNATEVINAFRDGIVTHFVVTGKGVNATTKKSLEDIAARLKALGGLPVNIEHEVTSGLKEFYQRQTAARNREMKDFESQQRKIFEAAENDVRQQLLNEATSFMNKAGAKLKMMNKTNLTIYQSKKMLERQGHVADAAKDSKNADEALKEAQAKAQQARAVLNRQQQGLDLLGTLYQMPNDPVKLRQLAAYSPAELGLE